MESILSGVGVLDKTMQLLGALEDGPASLAELTARTAVSRATAHRLLVALEKHGLVARDHEGDFLLGLHLATLGRRAIDSFPLAQVAEPVLGRLRDVTGESVQLYVIDGDRRRCVIALDSPHELRTIVAPGSLLPLGVGSGGRVLAGEAPGRGGWIETAGDRAEGVASVSARVAAPDGRPLAAISVSGPIDRIGTAPGTRHGTAVIQAATELEAALKN
jgi:DNA-binding IclR family transcriptional regulator